MTNTRAGAYTRAMQDATHTGRQAPSHIDEATLRAVAGWLRVMAPLFTARPQEKMLRVAALVESYNERARAHDRTATSVPPERKPLA